MEFESPAPNAATIDWVASEVPIKLAAETQATGAACATVTWRPATVSVPRREPAFGVLATAKLTMPSPLPVGPEGIVINGALDTPGHAQPAAAGTLTPPFPPC